MSGSPTRAASPGAWPARLLILGLAATLRLAAPGITEFKLDEANLSLLALDVAQGERFPLLGIGSSVGFPNAPVNVYLLAVPYLGGSHPVLANSFIGLLSLLAVALLFALARRYLSLSAAYFAALAYAVAPWAVVFSRKIWAQNLLHAWVVLVVYTGLLGWVEGKRWAQWLHLPLLALTLQIHFGALTLLPFSAYLLWQARPRWGRALWGSLALSALLFLPYGVGLARDGWFSLEKARDTRAAAEAASPAQTAQSGGPLTAQGWRLGTIALTGRDLHALTGPDAFRDYLARTPNADPLLNGLLLGMGAGALALLWRQDRMGRALVLWGAAPFLIYSVSWVEGTVHYFIPALPAGCLWLGAGWAALLRVSERFSPPVRTGLRYALGSGLGALFVLQVGLLGFVHHYVNHHATPGGFGQPLGYLLPVRQALFADHPARVLVRVDGMVVGLDNDATVWRALLDPVPDVRFLDAQTEVYPAETALVLEHACPGFALRSPAEGCYQVRQRSPGALAQAAFSPFAEATSLRFANGVRVQGYRWLGEGCLVLLWSTEQPASRNYSFAVHFLDAAGERIGQADRLAWLGQFWRPGDRIVSTFCLALPPQARATLASVNLGLYHLAGDQYFNVDLLDPQGAWAGQFINLPGPSH
ncbi:MAG: hypothetical protein HC915_10275 [Anaerolineae bacterium]|nr:hypothetical protein [Anaerolineae bacterium]